MGFSGKRPGASGKLLGVSGKLLGHAALFVTLQNSAGRQEVCETFFPGQTRRADTFSVHFKLVLASATGPNVVLGAWHLSHKLERASLEA